MFIRTWYLDGCEWNAASAAMSISDSHLKLRYLLTLATEHNHSCTVHIIIMCCEPLTRIIFSIEEYIIRYLNILISNWLKVPSCL